MFKIQELVNLINSGLNGVDENYSFNVYAEVGEEKNDGSINGILRTIGNDTTKIKGNSETRYTFVVEMPIISPRTNSNFLEIQQIVEQFVSSYNGSQQEFSSGNGVLHINMGVPKQFNVSVNLGDNVPLAFTIEMLYTENNLTNADKHWFLDGYEIPFKSENVLVNKDGIVRKINNKNYTEAFLTGQTKYYKFVFPHQDTELGNMIQADLLSGNFNKEYTLTYYDGRTFTEESPFETKVSIYQSGDVGTQEISVDVFNLTFADVDNGEYDWTYEFALIDSKFDNQTEDTRWFNSQAEQQAYYEEKVASGCEFVTIKAPNLNSLDITSQVYPNNRGYNVFDLTNKNYAIIKVSKSEPVQQVRYFYYWVTNAQIGANGQVMFDLSLDTVQTYLFDEDIEFGDCLIERSCLNRWVDNGDNTVSFDGGVNSKLFSREKIQDVPKRLTKRTKLGACNTGNVNFDNFINTYVLGWIYCYISPTSPIACNLFNNLTDNTQSENTIKIVNGIYLFGNEDLGFIPQPIPCLVFPVMKGNATGTQDIRARMGTLDSLGAETDIAYSFEKNLDGTINIDGFLNYFNDFVGTVGTDVIYSAKFSTLCPFDTIDDADYSIVDEGTLISLNLKMNRIQATNLGTVRTQYMYESPNKNLQAIPTTDKYHNLGTSLLVKRWQNPIYDLGNYEIDKQLSFNKNTIIGANKNAEFNPKLLSQDYFELQVCDETENGFSYDLQKLNKKEVQIGLTETLTPDNAKKYIRITNNDGVYVPETDKNLLGFVNSNDTSIILVSDQYANMLAQNKNYFTQNELGRWENLVPGVGSGLMTAALGAATMNPVAVIGGATQVLSSGANYVLSTIKQDLSIDNLKNSPASIKQALGNCYFGAQYTEPGTYVEEYDILPAEKNVINDYMVQYGFTTNQIGQIKDYLNSSPVNGRKYFNYIQAVVNSIGGIPMSNTARQNLRDRFAKGIRFWNDDNVDYDKENYEKWLESIKGTWYFKSNINVSSLPRTYYINFTSNSLNYNGIGYLGQGQFYTLTYEQISGQGEFYESVYSYNSWVNEAFRTITITGGEDIENEDLRTWLLANATLISA